jgi:TRAP-type C4-dicarboxylate transport system substrate-binding protein
MKKKLIRVLAVLFILISAGPLFAQRKITIKLASMVPENTPWGVALNRMAAEWSRVTNGDVTLQVYHNGVAGGETDVLRKLKQNQIQAAVFTSLGMSSIAKEVMTLSVPFFIQTDDELEWILSNVKGELEKKIDENGFYMLAWAKAGWVKIFSRSPVFAPDDLKRQKLGTSADQEELMQAFKAMGYRMVPMEINDSIIALNSGMVDAVYQSPIAVGGFQIFGIAKNMTDLNVAPFMGGIVMNRVAWRTVPDRYKPAITEVTNKIAEEIDSSINQLEEEAIRTMLNYGLIVNHVNNDQAKLWYADTERAMPALLGTTFNRDLYNRITVLLNNFRSGRR